MSDSVDDILRGGRVRLIIETTGTDPELQHTRSAGDGTGREPSFGRPNAWIEENGQLAAYIPFSEKPGWYIRLSADAKDGFSGTELAVAFVGFDRTSSKWIEQDLPRGFRTPQKYIRLSARRLAWLPGTHAVLTLDKDSVPDRNLDRWRPELEIVYGHDRVRGYGHTDSNDQLSIHPGQSGGAA